MNWTDRDPPETDPLLQMTIPHDGGGTPCRLEIDKLPDGQYRVTVGTLLEALELCRTSYLEMLLRLTYQLGVSRSFREVLTALQQLSELAADLGHANQGANLEDACDLTQEQLDTASGDDRTHLPEGLTRPADWLKWWLKWWLKGLKIEGTEDQPAPQPDNHERAPAADDEPGSGK
jgi:hypothetical protein